MLIENQMIEVKWNKRNKPHFVEKGYIFTKIGDIFLACQKDLPEVIKTVKTVDTKCAFCNKEFKKKAESFIDHGRHCCDRKCAAKLRAEKNYSNEKKEKITVSCESCSKEYGVHESVFKKNKWHFCSRECYSKFRSQELVGENNPSYVGLIANCDSCHKEFPITQTKINKNHNVFCSQDCYYKFRSIHYSGENHNQFGIKKTPEQIDKMRQITTKRIADGKFPQTNTSIQILTREFLLNIDRGFEEEAPFKYYVLDFYNKNKNLAIEVMGDYWHASPIKYFDYESLHDIQKKDIKRDKSKGTFLKKYYDINVLYLWERDINENPELCKKLIKLYIKNKGILEDYNSFNFELIENELILKSEIILPFFKRINTMHQKLSV